MIETVHPEFKINPRFVQSALSDKNFIRALATQLVAGQVEAHVEMISDAGPSEYRTFDDVAGCIAGAKETVQDFLADLLEEFCTDLNEEIKNVNIRTIAVLMKPDNEIDADVTVSYNVK
jgi:hypothetical protein